MASHILEALQKRRIKVQMVFYLRAALSRIEAEKQPPGRCPVCAPSENQHSARKGTDRALRFFRRGRLAANFKIRKGLACFYMNPIGIGVLPDELAAEKIPVPVMGRLKHEGLKGMIQMPSPQSSGTAFAIMMTLISIYGRIEAYAYMKALNPNIQLYAERTGQQEPLLLRKPRWPFSLPPLF